MAKVLRQMTAIGKVNGTAIDQTEFSKKVRLLENQEEQQSGQRPSNSRTAQIREQVWNQIVAEKSVLCRSIKTGY